MNTRSPPEYESFVAALARQLRESQHIADVSAGARNKARGRSGVHHQVDVSFIDNTGPDPVLVVVECKNLQHKAAAVSSAHVKVLKATVDDLTGQPGRPALVRGILVSTVRLQPGAAKFAAYYGIEHKLLSAGENWSFQYGKTTQFGLALKASPASVAGAAAVHRKGSSAARRE